MNFNIFGFTCGITSSIYSTPIRLWYGPFFFCDFEWSSGYLPRQIFVILYAYVDPHEEFEAEFNMFPPLVFVVTIVPVCTVFIKPPSRFEEYYGYVAVSSSVNPVRLELFQCSGCYCGIYVGGRPGTGLC